MAKRKVIMGKEILQTFPVLETDRLSLVQITSEHKDDLFEIYANENVMKYYDSYPHISKDETSKVIALFEQWFKGKTGIRWAITLKNEKKIIGTIGFSRFQPNVIGILGYDLDDKYWNKGIISEAIKKVTEFGFNNLQIHRIEALVIPENMASHMVLEKNGFKKEGILRDKGFWKDKYHTLSLYSKLATD